MEFVRPLPLLLILLSVLSTTQAIKFNVGGSAGWVPNPSQSYNQWAGSNRFQINDTLVFKYKKGSDSVLEVKKEDYDKCNKSNPIKKFDDGNTEFTLDHSGPFYFISGQDQNCQNKGQKLIVVVLAPRGTTPTPPSPKSPSPSPTPTPTPAPSGSPPVPAPTPAPAGNPPAPSVSPPTPTPATSPAPAGNSPSPSPVSGPPAPTPAGTTPSPSSGSPGPTTSPPVPPPATPPGGAAPGTANPPASSETAPPPGKNNAWAATPSKFLVYSATIVVAAVFFV